MHPFRIGRRLLVCRLFGDGLRIKDCDIGVSPDANAAFVLHRWIAFFKALCGHERHLAECVHERKIVRLAYIVAQDARVGAGGTGMSSAEDDHAVAGTHSQRIAPCPAADFLGIGEHDDVAALLAVLRVALLGQALAG